MKERGILKRIKKGEEKRRTRTDKRQRRLARDSKKEGKRLDASFVRAGKTNTKKGGKRELRHEAEAAIFGHVYTRSERLSNASRQLRENREGVLV